jgi:hypothetical protein
VTYDPSQHHQPQPYDPYSAPPVFDGTQPTTGAQFSHYSDQQQPQQVTQPAPAQYSQPQYTVPNYVTAYYGPPPQNGAGTAALILGILSLTVCMLTSIPAIICGIIGMGRAKRGEADNHGMALGGLICGVISLVLTAGVIIFYIVLITSFASASTSTNY